MHKKDQNIQIAELMVSRLNKKADLLGPISHAISRTETIVHLSRETKILF